MLRKYFGAVTHVNALLTMALVLLLSIFFFAVFRHLSYPLFWNDEAETAMFGERILSFGYPKVHDGKNVLNLTDHPDVTLGVNQWFDAWVAADWAQYYVAAVGVAAGHSFSDLYLRTLLVRIPFVIAGCVGLFLFAGSVLVLWPQQRKRHLLFAILFLIQTLLSIPLLLHLRQARYYPLLLLVLGGILWLALRYGEVFRERKKGTGRWLTALLILSFFVFHPAFFAIIGGLLAATITLFLIRHTRLTLSPESAVRIIPPSPDNWEQLFFLLGPYGVSLIVATPLVIFFKSFQFASGLTDASQFGFWEYAGNVAHIVQDFFLHGFLATALLMKGASLAAYYRTPDRRALVRPSVFASLYLTVFFIGYALIIANIPYTFFFQRYYIVLQPVLSLIFLLDVFIMVDVFSGFPSFPVPLSNHRVWMATRSVCACFVIILGLLGSIVPLRSIVSNARGMVFELRHPYRGPLDYIIPYIRDTFPLSEKMVIATNYEEDAYMFYLHAKTTIGFVLNNISEDIKIIPDVIVFRGGWEDKQGALAQLHSRASYRKITFPIHDYWVNNIPETVLSIHHLFETQFVDSGSPNATALFIHQ